MPAAPTARSRSVTLLALGLVLGTTLTSCFGARRAAARRAAEEEAQAAAEQEALALLDGRPLQTDSDEYTAYELGDPAAGEFDVRYEVSVTTSGATNYFNPLRPGAAVRDCRAFDLYTGEELATEVVDAKTAREQGHPQATAQLMWLAVRLARAVPEGGQTRLRIEKVYQDPAGYFLDNQALVFGRWLTIERNSVLLPSGYEIESCNIPVQVFPEQDGRLRVSLTKSVQIPVLFLLRARQLTPVALPNATAAAQEQPGLERLDAAALDAAQPAAFALASRTTSRAPVTFAELAREDREVLFDLDEPETGTYRVQRDSTESRQGCERFVVVDDGRVLQTRAFVLDTGEPLQAEIRTGAELQAAADPELDLTGIAPDDQTVVVHHAPLEGGRSLRVRVDELRQDSERYGIDGDELTWTCELGPRIGTVVLPQGWYLTACSVPATVGLTGDGRVRLEYRTPRPEGTQALVRAKRRTEGSAPGSGSGAASDGAAETH